MLIKNGKRVSNKHQTSKSVKQNPNIEQETKRKNFRPYAKNILHFLRKLTITPQNLKGLRSFLDLLESQSDKNKSVLIKELPTLFSKFQTSLFLKTCC